MAILNFFKTYPPTLLRCTECEYEDMFTYKELRCLAKRQPENSPCPFQTECHICHIGFMIPVDYSAPNGKHYRFHEIKPQINNLDPNTLMERIYTHPDTISASFLNPFDEQDHEL